WSRRSDREFPHDFRAHAGRSRDSRGPYHPGGQDRRADELHGDAHPAHAGNCPDGPALYAAHHRHLACREWKACRTLGRGRHCRTDEAAARRVKDASMEGEMLKGHLDMIVLAALAAGPAHGYAVIEEIKRRSGDAFDLPEGTVYPALHRLEDAGLLASRWETAESGRRRRVYTLTKR